MLADIAGLVGRKAPTTRLPYAVIYPIAFISEQVARLTGKAPLATIDGVRMSKYRMFFSDAKARSELGYTSRPYRDGLSDAISWFRQAGYTK
jgi:dihydroflavonol-4-reductase